MEIQIVAIIGLLFLLMVSLIFHWRQFDHSEKKATEILKLKEELEKKPKKQDSLELQEFLGDLFQGAGVVRVERVDPSSIFLHSPKGYQN